MRPLADLLLVGYGPKVATERALRDIPGVERAFITGSWAARYSGTNGLFPHDIDVTVVGEPDRDDKIEAVVESLRELGHDAQVIFRTPGRGRSRATPSPKAAQAHRLVELDLSEEQ